MIDITVRTKAWDGFRRNFPRRHDSAVKSSMKLIMFREITPGLKGDLKGGIGPAKAPLTKLQAKRGGTKALAAYAPLVAYTVKKESGGWKGQSGPSQEAGGGFRKKAIPEDLIRATAEGRRVRITVKRRNEMRRKINRKEGRRLASAIGRGRTAVAKRSPDQYLPAPGRILSFPKRDYVTEYVRRNGRRIGRIWHRFYVAKLAGRRL